MGEGGYKQINKTLNICAFEDYLTAQTQRLPDLTDVQQLTPRVLRILGQNPGKFTLQGTNTYIVGTGRRRLIIDTAQGYREWADLVDGALTERSLGLSQVLLTHWHGDHTGGVPDLIRMYPNLKESIYKNSPESDQKAIEHDDVFEVEGATIRAVHAPGHSHDHMCFILEEESAMFTGDNVLGHGTSAVEELGEYIGMLRKLQSYDCAVGFPAHGDVIPNLPDKITGELAQKQRREKQCLGALSKIRAEQRKSGEFGSVTVPELVVAMHGEALDAEVRKKALEPFTEEVLRRLSEENKVGFHVRKGERKWFAVESAHM